jgi:hypothetical protein
LRLSKNSLFQPQSKYIILWSIVQISFDCVDRNLLRSGNPKVGGPNVEANTWTDVG